MNTLQEFIDLLLYSNKPIEIEDLSTQSQILNHLYTVLSYKEHDSFKYLKLFLHPTAKKTFVTLCEKLDENFESKAAEIFQVSSLFTLEYSECDDIRNSVYDILGKLKERFPSLQQLEDRQLDSLLSAFFEPKIDKFLDKYLEGIDQISITFPSIYELFVSPLIASPTYTARGLFNFYCNPYIYNPIVDFLGKQDYPHRLSEKHLERLEKRLQTIRLHTNDESWEELSNKSRELLASSNELEAFTNKCSGLLGEINTAFYLINNVCHPGDLLIFLKDDNRLQKKVKERSCDLMIVRKGEQDRILIEVKTKSPRHGVEEANVAVWDDFFSNFHSSISSYLSYLDLNFTPIFGLSLRRALPLFSTHEYSSYGLALPAICPILINDPSLHDNPASKWKSEKKIRTLLSVFFMKPLVLNPFCVPLASTEVRYLERQELIEKVLQKDWVLNTMQDATAQIEEAYEHHLQNSHRISQLFVALDLSLSYRLLHDFFCHQEEDMRGFVAKILEETFAKFKEDFLKKGLNLELLLP